MDSEDEEEDGLAPDLSSFPDSDPSSPDEEGEEKGLQKPLPDLRRFVPSAERRAPRHLWLISYSDFMTILMIFFLAMYAYTYLAKATLIKTQQTTPLSAFADLADRLGQGGGDHVRIKDETDKIVVHLAERILFPSGRADLVSTAGQTLDELANSIKLAQGDVIVQGHTDNVPVVGGYWRSNWELSAARSFSVIQGLVQRGVPPERLAAWGFGEHRPLVLNDSKGNQARNRRIEIVILKKDKKA